MQQDASSAAANGANAANVAFLALKGLATLAEAALLGGVLYAAFMAARYWPSIGV